MGDGPRILLTGGGGFIGQALKRALGTRHEVFAPTRAELDLTSADAVAAWMAGHPVDAVVHGAVQPGHRNSKDPSHQLERNCRMFFNLARCLKGGQRMVFLGSGAAYDVRLPMDLIREEAFDRSVPGDEHGFSKYICAKHMEARDAFVELRLFGVFGPGEDPFIRFISNATCKALLGLPISCRQDRRFSYLWVEDLAPVVESFLEGPRGQAAWNVAPPEAASLVGIAERVVAITGSSSPILVANPGEGLPYTACSAPLMARLPGLRFTPLDEAIAQLAAHYRRNLDALDRDAFKVDP